MKERRKEKRKSWQGAEGTGQLREFPALKV